MTFHESAAIVMSNESRFGQKVADEPVRALCD
jgi:hypothetical protein